MTDVSTEDVQLSALDELSGEATAALMRSVTTARWFAGKGRRAEFRSFVPLAWLNDPPPPAEGEPEVPRVRLAVLEVGYPDEAVPAPGDGLDEPDEVAPGTELYQVALAYHREAVDTLAHAEHFRVASDGAALIAYDATQDPAGAAVLLGSLLGERDATSESGRVGFHLRDAGPLTTDLVAQAFRGQQSNTSVMYGDVAMLKLFRRLELGHNLDIQVHSALGEAGVEDVATLYGWVDATWTADGEVLGADLAMCVEKLRDAVDGWDLALASLASGTAGTDGGPGFAEHAAALGRALALTHHALRDAFGTSDQPGTTVARVMSRRLEAATAIAPALAPYGDGLRGRFASLDDAHLDVQRVHGDFHLGQTLHTPSGWKIIDFEGEPAKSLAERVAPDSVWRDVAGMMRSFDYAAASVPDAVGLVGSTWRDRCREAFLDGYTAGAGLRDDEASLLAAYEADKAVYEVVYEVRNRPDWVGIPLGAVAALAEEPTGSTPEKADTP